MGLIDKLTNVLSRSSPELRKYDLHELDANDEPLDPTTVMAQNDVSAVVFEFDHTRIEVRRIFGHWECLSCQSTCSHDEIAHEIIDEWVQFNNE
jgi:hypothetical protein